MDKCQVCPKCGTKIPRKKMKILKYEPILVPNVVPPDKSTFIYRLLLTRTIKKHVKNFLRKITKRHLQLIMEDNYVLVAYGFDYIKFQVETNGDIRYIISAINDEKGSIHEGVVNEGEWYLGNEEYDTTLEYEINDILSQFFFQEEWAKARLSWLTKKKKEIHSKKHNKEGEKSAKGVITSSSIMPSKYPMGNIDGFFGMMEGDTEPPPPLTDFKGKNIIIPSDEEISNRRKEKRNAGLLKTKSTLSTIKNKIINK